MKITAQMLADIVGGSHEALIGNKAPPEVGNYLVRERGLLPSTIKCYKIGYCGIEIERVVNREYYEGSERFANIPPEHLRDKIIVPICDDSGKVVAFATRSVGKGQPWWNTAYKKGNVLFNLNFARSQAFHENKLYVVEGYFDSCILYQNMIQNVVATMGTKLTKVQIGLALRYCDRLCLCFDADLGKNGKIGAGQKAMVKTYELAKNYFSISAIRLPLSYDITTDTHKGTDPDEYLLKHGKAGLLGLESENFVIEDQPYVQGNRY
jgi:DNA primase